MFPIISVWSIKSSSAYGCTEAIERLDLLSQPEIPGRGKERKDHEGKNLKRPFGGTKRWPWGRGSMRSHDEQASKKFVMRTHGAEQTRMRLRLEVKGPMAEKEIA